MNGTLSCDHLHSYDLLETETEFFSDFRREPENGMFKYI